MGKRQSKLKSSALEDLRSVTQFSNAEIREMYKGFLMETPSGLVTKEEFKTMYSILVPYGDSSDFAEHVFRTFDTNGDDFIDFREFLCALSITSKGETEDKLELAFEMYDIDKDGFITRGEMLDVITSTAKMVQANDPTIENRLEKIFRQMDTNRDEQISLEEFIESAKNDPGFCKLYQYFPMQ
jgi:Ca2+-binding EF-hand superfamily protein